MSGSQRPGGSWTNWGTNGRRVRFAARPAAGRGCVVLAPFQYSFRPRAEAGDQGRHREELGAEKVFDGGFAGENASPTTEDQCFAKLVGQAFRLRTRIPAGPA